MSNSWIQRRRKDQYYRLAKVRGYRSRAAYKLIQAIKTYEIIRPGQTVLDLGSNPGGWVQVAREKVGPAGLVVGVDVKPTEFAQYSNVRLIHGDVYSKDIVERILLETNGPVDTVLSDLAPSIIGSWDIDHARQVDLARTALDIAKKLLKRGGNVMVKLFQGPELKPLTEDARELFRNSKLLKPKASRPESSEIYFLGTGFKLEWRDPRAQSLGTNRD